MKKKNTISDKELLRMLASMREEVAAPSGFSRRIIARLEAESGRAERRAARHPWAAFIDFISAKPVLVPALAASLALGFGLWFAARGPVPSAPSISMGASSPSAAAPQAASAPAAPRHIAKAKAKAEPAVAASLPSSGSQSLASSQQAPSSGAVGLEAKPTVIVVMPAPTAMDRPLERASQVRRNKFSASKGEFAAVMVNLRQPGHLRIECYNRNGRLVAVVFDGEPGAGVSELRWYGYDSLGQPAPAGIYLIRVKASDFDERHKVVLVR